MRKIISWLLGVSLGAAFGAVLIALFMPESAEAVRDRLRDGYRHALDVAREAQAARRAELEAQLADMQKSRDTESA